MVGRTVRASLRRLCGVARGGLRICGRRRGFRPGRRFDLGRPAWRCSGADGRGADDQASLRRDARKSQSRTGIAPEMTILRPLSILAGCLLWTASAYAQISLAPPAAQTPPAASKPVAKPKAKAPAVAKKPAAPAATPKPAATPAPAATVTPAPAPDDPNVDLVFGAYQRGQYKTAFDLATNRAKFNGDPKAMTMLGELYANAMGVKRDYAKAAEWYQRAADGGDREGMFALAMLRLSGRGGPVNREEAVKLLA